MSVAKNYIYNVFYQILILILPIVTVPYISRVLGSYGVGLNAYTNSIAQYFILLGTMGVSLYGNRAIAYVRDDKSKLSETFWGIFYLKLMTTFVAFIAFIIFIYAINVTYKEIYFIQSIYIISAAVDISWFFMGIEDFKKTVTRNTLVKLIIVCMIFLFVKNRNDIWKYVLLLACGELFGQLFLWISIKKYVNFIHITIKDVFKYLNPALAMFVPQMAIQIYAVLDRTMVGIISTTSEVGYYDNAQKIVKISLAVVTSLGTVMLPKMTNTFAKGDKKGMNHYIEKSFRFVSFLAFPIMFGIIGISSDFVPWFFGREFLKCGILIDIISPIIVAIAWSNVLGIQVMLPMGKTKEFTISVTAGAAVNFILNMFLIKRYSSVGASVASVIAEVIVTLVQFLLLRQMLPLRKMFNNIWKYIISSILMLLVIQNIGIHMKPEFITTLIQTLVGIAVYIITTIILVFKLDISFKDLLKNI